MHALLLTLNIDPVKLHPDSLPALNTVTAYGAGYVEINQVRYAHSILMTPDAPIRAWPVTAFSGLAAEHFAMLLEFMPELVIFGSGAQLRFPPVALTAALNRQRIGVETMDLQAACRTYNVLMAEGRQVAAALLIETETTL
jgi:uncharacterized protein